MKNVKKDALTSANVIKAIPFDLPVALFFCRVHSITFPYLVKNRYNVMYKKRGYFYEEQYGTVKKRQRTEAESKKC